MPCARARIGCVGLARSSSDCAKPGGEFGSDWPEFAGVLPRDRANEDCRRDRRDQDPESQLVHLARKVPLAAAMKPAHEIKILVGTDFSTPGDETLGKAIEHARRMGAELEIVHVIERIATIPIEMSYTGMDRDAPYPAVDRDLAERSERVSKAGIVCTTKRLEGKAPEEIVKRAQEIGADLIVVGTHGRSGLAHVLLGSGAERVVQQARCPVLVVPFSRRTG